MKNKFIWISLIIVFLYHTLLMQMLPWNKYNFSCELSTTNIKKYNVPRFLELRINGWGSGKFTNKQYFENKSFNLDTNGSNVDSLYSKVFGSPNYDFYIPYKENLFGYDWGYTHLFTISKKNLRKHIESKKIDLKARMLVLIDVGDATNNQPEAIWDCNQK